MKKKTKLDGIAISDFVEYYLGTKHNCIKLKHQGLKSFENPYVIGVSNDIAFKNPDYIAKNELIVVMDDYGNPGTYINPNHIKKLMELEIAKEQIKILSKISCHSFEEVAYLYKIWEKLFLDIRCLEGLYGNLYELFYYINKINILNNIKRIAREEAKRTLIFTAIKNHLIDEKTIEYYDNDIEHFKENHTIELEIDYGITEKRNRQKKLDERKEC